mgnify:CR=1 FL=1
MDYIKFLKYVNLEDHRIDDLLSLSSHNGPYYDEETKVRLLSHYIIAYCKFSKVKDTERFNQLILSMAQELCDEKYRPDGYTFLCRMGNKKDKTNGVIGQAWVIEALVELYVYFGEGKYLDLAKRIFLMHPYDSKIGGWHCVSIEGKIMRLRSITAMRRGWRGLRTPLTGGPIPGAMRTRLCKGISLYWAGCAMKKAGRG